MAATSTTPDPTQSAPVASDLLISLASLSHEAFDHTLANIATAFPNRPVVVATPDLAGHDSAPGAISIAGYTPSVAATGGWTLTAADFLNTHELATQYQAKSILLLGSEAQSLEPEALRRLIDSQSDLTTPRYELPPRAGLVNSAILYPISRALFGAIARYPLALDLGLSARMAERLATAAQRFTAANQPDALIWPVAEAAVAGYSITQVEAGTRSIPPPAAQDLNTLLAQVAGSLFADVDAQSRVLAALSGRPGASL